MVRRAAFGSVAEQPAGRDVGITGDVFQRKAVGKTLTRFPGAHRGVAEPQLDGDLFLAEVLAEAPVFEDKGEIRPQIAGSIHALGLTPNAGRGKIILETRQPHPHARPQNETGRRDEEDGKERGRPACGFGRRARTIVGQISLFDGFSARRRKRRPGRSRSPFQNP